MTKAAPAVREQKAYPRRARKKEDEQVIKEAIGILEKRLRRPRSPAITCPAAAIALAQLLLAEEEREHFLVVYLTNSHQLISHERLFSGTIDGASVYPREVVKGALQANAAAVIFAHNHPSGNSEPSEADICITERLQEALSLVEVRVLDHIVIAGADYCSMAAKELI